jgi:hypothetical protein
MVWVTGRSFRRPATPPRPPGVPTRHAPPIGPGQARSRVGYVCGTRRGWGQGPRLVGIKSRCSGSAAVFADIGDQLVLRGHRPTLQRPTWHPCQFQRQRHQVTRSGSGRLPPRRTETLELHHDPLAARRCLPPTTCTSPPGRCAAVGRRGSRHLRRRPPPPTQLQLHQHTRANTMSDTGWATRSSSVVGRFRRADRPDRAAICLLRIAASCRGPAGRPRAPRSPSASNHPASSHGPATDRLSMSAKSAEVSNPPPPSAPARFR